MTFLKALVRDWVGYLCIEKGVSVHTVSSYRRDVARYALDTKGRGKVNIEGISPRDIEDYAMYLASGQITEALTVTSSVTRISAVIRGFYKYVLTEGTIGTDVAAQLYAPRRGRHLPKALSVDEVGRLLDATYTDGSPIGLRDAALLELLYVTGIRVSEAVSLSANDLDLDGDVPAVRLFGKGHKEWVAPVGSLAVDTLYMYRVRTRPAPAVRGRGSIAFFLSSQGSAPPRQSAWAAIRRAAKATQLGERVSPHTLRYSFATHLLEGGVSVRKVQEFLGYTSVAATQICTQVMATVLREVFTLSHLRAYGTDTSTR